MLESREKERILKEAGFHYHFERSLYFNRETRKIFSVEAIDDHPVEWLNACISEPSRGSEWQFYFNALPSTASMTSILDGFK